MLEMEAKKISFGFSKTIKKTNLINEKPAEKEEKIELIKCLEGKEIKLVEEPKPKELLVIPLIENRATSAALASLIKRRAVLNNEDEPDAGINDVTEEKLQSKTINESLEQRAARELMSEVETLDAENSVNKNLVLPILKLEDVPLAGAKEPTLDDYETIPIREFGRAMLRGMGWVDPPPEKDKPLKTDVPIPRPKGMGLGADKALKPQPLLVQPEKNESLEIKPQAFVRILGGKLKDRYGQIVSFDDYAGRVIVKIAIGGAMEVFNEFMCQPVAKKEYEKYAKCINTAKYEAYKSLENEYGQIIIKKENDMASTGADELTKNDEFNKDVTRIKKEFELDYKHEGLQKNIKRNMDYKMPKNSDDSINNKDLKNKSSNLPEELKYPKNPPLRYESDYKEQSSSSHRHRQIRATSNSSDSNSDTARCAYYSKDKSKLSNSSRKHRNKRKPHDNSSKSEDDSPVTETRHKSRKKKSKKGRRKQSRSGSRSRRR